MDDLFPIRAAAKITGLSIDILRAWERRYQAVAPSRTSRGRQYTQTDLDRLLLLRQLVDRGHSIGSIGNLDEAALQVLLQGPPRTPPLESAVLIEKILAAIENYDGTRAEGELRRLAAILLPIDLVHRVILPLMRRVGDEVHAGTLSIAQEHMTTSAVRTVLGGLVRPSPAPVKMVFATPETELHELGVLVAAMLAAVVGFEPVYLGASLPFQEVLLAAKKTNSKAVVIGATGDSDTIRQQLRHLHNELPARVELWLGGAAAADFSTEVGGPQSFILKDFNEFEDRCRWFRGRN